MNISPIATRPVITSSGHPQFMLQFGSGVSLAAQETKLAIKGLTLAQNPDVKFVLDPMVDVEAHTQAALGYLGHIENAGVPAAAVRDASTAAQALNDAIFLTTHRLNGPLNTQAMHTDLSAALKSLVSAHALVG